MQHHRAHLDYIVVPMSLLIVLAANDLEYQHNPFFAFNSQNSKRKICFGFPFISAVSNLWWLQYFCISNNSIPWCFLGRYKVRHYSQKVSKWGRDFTKNSSSSLPTSQFTDGNTGRANIWLQEQQTPQSKVILILMLHVKVIALFSSAQNLPSYIHICSAILGLVCHKLNCSFAS